MASVLFYPDNQGEDKHVESRLVPRLDESSNLSSSTKKGINQYFNWFVPFFVGIFAKCHHYMRKAVVYFYSNHSLQTYTFIFMTVSCRKLTLPAIKTCSGLAP